MILDQIAAEGRSSKPKASVTIGDLIETYESSFKSTPGRAKTSLAAMSATCGPSGSARAIRWDQLTQKIVDDYVAWRLTQPAWKDHKRKVTAPGKLVGGSTVNKDLRILRAVLNTAHKQRVIPHPVNFSINVSAEPSRDQWLTKAEVGRMLELCETRESVLDAEGRVVARRRDREHLEAFILISVATAARKEAVLSLTWDMVHIPDKSICQPTSR